MKRAEKQRGPSKPSLSSQLRRLSSTSKMSVDGAGNDQPHLPPISRQVGSWRSGAPVRGRTEKRAPCLTCYAAWLHPGPADGLLADGGTVAPFGQQGPSCTVSRAQSANAAAAAFAPSDDSHDGRTGTKQSWYACHALHAHTRSALRVALSRPADTAARLGHSGPVRTKTPLAPVRPLQTTR